MWIHVSGGALFLPVRKRQIIKTLNAACDRGDLFIHQRPWTHKVAFPTFSSVFSFQSFIFFFFIHPLRRSNSFVIIFTIALHHYYCFPIVFSLCILGVCYTQCVCVNVCVRGARRTFYDYARARRYVRVCARYGEAHILHVCTANASSAAAPREWIRQCTFFFPTIPFARAVFSNDVVLLITRV